MRLGCWLPLSAVKLNGSWTIVIHILVVNTSTLPLWIWNQYCWAMCARLAASVGLTWKVSASDFITVLWKLKGKFLFYHWGSRTQTTGVKRPSVLQALEPSRFYHCSYCLGGLFSCKHMCMHPSEDAAQLPWGSSDGPEILKLSQNCSETRTFTLNLSIYFKLPPDADLLTQSSPHLQMYRVPKLPVIGSYMRSADPRPEPPWL